MPQRRASIKALRQNRKNRLRNLDIKTDLKKTIKKFSASVTANKADEAREQLKAVYKKLDKAAKTHILHKNTVARRKSRFGKMVNRLSAKPPASDAS